MTKDVPVRRAKQRAKKIAAQGGSHQKALDDIARAGGHAHWSARLDAAGAPATFDADRHAADAAVVFTRTWLLHDPVRHDACVSFVVSCLSHEAKPKVTSLVAKMFVGMWLRRHPSTMGAETVSDAVASLMVASFDMLEEARTQASRTGSSFTDRQGHFLNRMILESTGDITLAESSLLKQSDGLDIEHAAACIAHRCRVIANSPVDAMIDVDSSRLPLDVVAAMVASKADGAMLDARQRDAIDRLVSLSPPSTPFAGDISWGLRDIASALGDEVERMRLALCVRGMTCGVVSLLLDRLPLRDGARGMVETYGSALGAGSSDCLTSSWLLDSFEKIDAGARPFSYNPLAGAMSHGMTRSADADLLVAISPLPLTTGRSDGEASAKAVRLIADLAWTLRGAGSRKNELGVDDAPISLPMISTVIDRWVPNPAQIALFASLNGMDRDLVARLRSSLLDASTMSLVRDSLLAFRNEALARAAS